MADPYIGEIRMFAGNFAPLGWASCSGDLLAISQNDTLYALIGTTYGGDGQSTFALPDLRGRVPIHYGIGTGLTQRVIGSTGGSESVTLTSGQLPAHNHPLVASASPGNQTSPAGNMLAQAPHNAYTPSSGTVISAATQMVGTAGGSQPHQNMQPYLAIMFIIALEGIYPSQS